MAYSLKLDGRVINITLNGSVDLSITTALKEEIEQVMSSDITSVRVNASSLDYIDSSGVASLLFIKKLCSRFSACLIVESISPPAARVIQLANLDSVFDFPKVASTPNLISAQQGQASRIEEPNFSDTDALAIFQNDFSSTPLVTTSKSLDPGNFEIKPPSFT